MGVFEDNLERLEKAKRYYTKELEGNIPESYRTDIEFRRSFLNAVEYGLRCGKEDKEVGQWLAIDKIVKADIDD